jgi:4'-phosphopantetheinyl transferase
VIPMNVYWLEQKQADVPQQDDWLSPFEAERLSQMLVRKRRDDWRLGRWTAKRALAARTGLDAHSQALAKLEIRAATSGAPEVVIDNQPADATISLSHRAGTGLCAVAPAGVAMGCDLELIEPRSDPFIADYFTVEEQATIAETSDIDRFRLVALLWSAKESALKALHAGLRLDTRCVSVRMTDSPGRLGWTPLQVRHCGGKVFDGWWRQTGPMVCTVVAEPPVEAPIAIAIEVPSADNVFQCA